MAFILSTYLDLSLRDDGLLSVMIFGKHIDHSTFGKAFHRIPYSYLKRLLLIIRNEIRNLVEEKPVLIADSTGVEVDRIYRKTMIGCKYTRRKIHGKLNIVVEYYPRNRLLSISGADSLLPSDPLSAHLIIEKLETKAGYFLGDAGFDSEPPISYVMIEVSNL